MLACALTSFLVLTSSLTLIGFYVLIIRNVKQSIELSALMNASIRSKTIKILKEDDLEMINGDLETSGTVISHLISF